MMEARLFESGRGIGALLIALAALLLFPLAGRTQDVKKVFDDGNAYYEKGEYEKAARKYKKILEYGVESPLVYYNLGNAFFKMDNLGEAILYYEKGLKIDPKDKDLRENLFFARSLTKDKVEGEELSFPSRVALLVTRSFSLDGWLAMVLVFYLALSTAVFLYITSRRYVLKRLCVYAGALFLIFSLVAAFAAAFHYQRLNVEKNAVILEEEVSVKSAPARDSKVLFPIHEGTKVEVSEKAGEWFHIVLPNGLHGWVGKEVLGLI